MMQHMPQRGFTLLIAVVLSSISLSIGLVLLDLALKQVLLSSAARQSQVAFYNADSVLECALYYDQRNDTFGYGEDSGTVACNGSATPITVAFDNDTASLHVRSFSVPCASGGTLGTVTITKTSEAETNIYANGYNTCTDSARRIERGMKVSY